MTRNVSVKISLDATKPALTASTHTTIGIALLTLLVVLLISLHKELSGAGPLRGIVHLGFAVLGICTFIALMAGLFHGKDTIADALTVNR